jgi:hypothetical protein
VNDWNKLSSTLNIDISLGFQPEDISVGVDGNSLSGFRFYGQTSPKTLVHLYIFSDPIFKSTQSDENGNWSVTVSDPLPSGTHKVYAVAVVEGVGSKNSNVVSFSIDSASKAIAMGGIENLPLTGNGLPQTGETTTVTDTPTNNVWIYILCCSGLVLFGVLIFIIYKKKKKKDSK